jgi:predicted transcriptional regulator
MKKPSIQAVIASEESRNILLFLDEGPKDLNDIIVSLRITKEELLSIIGSLERSYLVAGENNIYRLTQLGGLILEELKPLWTIEELMSSADGYLLNRKLDFIPPDLLKRLHEIRSFTVVQPHFSEIHDYNKDVHEMNMSSKSFSMAAAGIKSNYLDLYSDLIEKGVNLSLILDPELFNKIRRDHYEELEKLLKNRQVILYLHSQKMRFLSFKVNDSCIILKLLSHDGEYDHKHLICCSAQAVKWGKDLFEYYLKDSKLITEV